MRRVSVRARALLAAELFAAFACGPSRSPATDASGLDRSSGAAPPDSGGSSGPPPSIAAASSALPQSPGPVADACRRDPGSPLTSGLGRIERLMSGTWYLCPGTGQELSEGLNLMRDVKGLSIQVHPRDHVAGEFAVFEGAWGIIAAEGGHLVELPPGCGRRSARGLLTVTRDVLETEQRTHAYTGEHPGPVGTAIVPPPQGEELESAPFRVRPRSLHLRESLTGTTMWPT